MSDEQYHEFHLEGKQLIFLFMAAMAVVVVSFLCGVMVGRGVHDPALDVERLALAAEDDESSGDAGDESALGETATASTVPGRGSGLIPDEDLSYYERLTSPAPVPETLTADPVGSPRAASAPPAPPAHAPVQEPIVQATREPEPPAAPAPTRASSAPAATPAPTPPAVRVGAPAGSGYAVQVILLSNRAGAVTLAEDLTSKGYPAFVDPTSDGAFRVRVGKYPNRAEAERIARRLEREEKFKSPWVDR